MSEIEPGEGERKEKEPESKEPPEESVTGEYSKKVMIYDSEGNLAEEKILSDESELEKILEIESEVTEEGDVLIIRRK